MRLDGGGHRLSVARIHDGAPAANRMQDVQVRAFTPLSSRGEGFDHHDSWAIDFGRRRGGRGRLTDGKHLLTDHELAAAAQIHGGQLRHRGTRHVELQHRHVLLAILPNDLRTGVPTTSAGPMTCTDSLPPIQLTPPPPLTRLASLQPTRPGPCHDIPPHIARRGVAHLGLIAGLIEQSACDLA